MIERIREMLKRGMSNKEIMQATGLSKTAVQNYIRKMMREFGIYGNGNQRLLIVRLLTGGNGAIK